MLRRILLSSNHISSLFSSDRLLSKPLPFHYNSRPQHQTLLTSPATQQPLVVHFQHHSQPLPFSVRQVTAFRLKFMAYRPHNSLKKKKKIHISIDNASGAFCVATYFGVGVDCGRRLNELDTALLGGVNFEGLL